MVIDSVLAVYDAQRSGIVATRWDARRLSPPPW